MHTVVHTVKFRGSRWSCSCRARGTGNTSAEAHAFESGHTIQMGGHR